MEISKEILLNKRHKKISITKRIIQQSLYFRQLKKVFRMNVRPFVDVYLITSIGITI